MAVYTVVHIEVVIMRKKKNSVEKFEDIWNCYKERKKAEAHVVTYSL